MKAGASAIPRHTRSSEPPLTDHALYTRWRPVIFDLLLRRLGHLEEAEGICQEALLRTLKAHRAGKVQRFGPYAMRTALNLATDRLRRRRFVGEVADVESALSVVDELGAPEHARLRTEVKALPESLRQVVELRYEQELSFAEIADALGMSKNAVFARHRKALDALRAAFSRRRS